MTTTQTLTPENAARVIRKYGGIVAEPVSSPDRGLALGIYGPGGIGKTTLAATITDSVLGSPGLLLDARGNPHVISSYASKIDILPISKFSDLERIRQDILKDKDFPYKSLILDNVSEMWSINLRDRYGAAAQIAWQMHSGSTSDVLQLVRNYIDLTTGPFKLNVIFIFQKTPEARNIRGQDVPSRSEVAFNKALQSHVPTLVNFLGRLYQTEDDPPYTRLLDFRPVEAVHQAKLQVDRKDELAKTVPMEMYNPSLAPLLDTIRGRKPFPVDRHTAPARTSRRKQ